MYIFLHTILDFIFPPSEELLLVRSLHTKDIASLSTYRIVNGVHTLTPYKDARVRALIHEAKFHNTAHAFSLLNEIFSRFLTTYNKPFDYILPVPLSKRRGRTRGYNQVYEILKAGTVHIPAEIRTDILIRTIDTKPQTELSREKRLVNVRGAFGVRNSELLRGKHILIVDDVTTTGATLRTAKASLLPYFPASVTCVAIAH